MWQMNTVVKTGTDYIWLWWVAIDEPKDKERDSYNKYVQGSSYVCDGRVISFRRYGYI